MAQILSEARRLSIVAAAFALLILAESKADAADERDRTEAVKK
jgi:hypothetical protein